MDTMFKCQMCGVCCETKFLCLYPFELKKADYWAHKLNIKLQTEPLRMILDEKSQKIVVLIYRVTDRPCPFYSNRKCSIHVEKFVACHKYPISQWIDLGKVFSFLGLKNEFYDVDDKCTYIKTHPEFKTLLRTRPLAAIFPNEYRAVLEDKKIWIALQNRFNALKRTGKIRKINEKKLLRDSPEKYRRILDLWEKVPADDFENHLELR
jgi:Fe-S-cluster containining protein